MGIGLLLKARYQRTLSVSSSRSFISTTVESREPQLSVRPLSSSLAGAPLMVLAGVLLHGSVERVYTGKRSLN